MERITFSELFGGYLYGPADLEDIVLGDGYVRLVLRDSAGRAFSAVYRGCAYWSITQRVIGKHFSIVQEVKAEKLTLPEYAGIRRGLQGGGVSALELLSKWELEGYRFYFHNTSEADGGYLVVAKEVRMNA